MNGFQRSSVAVNGLVRNGLGRSCFQYFLMNHLEKHWFLCFWGVVMTAGLVKACFQWYMMYGLEKAYSLWLILVFSCWILL